MTDELCATFFSRPKSLETFRERSARIAARCNNAQRGRDAMVHRVHTQCLPYWLACSVLRNVINTSLTHALNTALASLPLCESRRSHCILFSLSLPRSLFHSPSLHLSYSSTRFSATHGTCIHGASNECNRERERNRGTDGSHRAEQREKE